MDISGEQHSAITQDVNKTSILVDGSAKSYGKSSLVRYSLYRSRQWEGKGTEIEKGRLFNILRFFNFRMQIIVDHATGQATMISGKLGDILDVLFSTPRCCNTCEAVMEAYRTRGWSVPDPLAFEQCKDEKEVGSLGAIGQEGCRVVGKLEVNKVAGSFHIAPGKSFGEGHVHVHDLMAFAGKQVS